MFKADLNASCEYVRFAEILNEKGLAFLTEKTIPLDMLLANRTALKHSASLLTPFDSYHRYSKAILPKKVYTNLQNNIDIVYDVLVTHVDTSNLYLYIHLMKLTQSFELLQKMKNDFEAFFEGQNNEDLRFSMETIDKNLEKHKSGQACICKFEKSYFRGEIISHHANKVYLGKCK